MDWPRANNLKGKVVYLAVKAVIWPYHVPVLFVPSSLDSGSEEPVYMADLLNVNK